MTVSPIQTEFVVEVGLWIDFANLTCDHCGAVYPFNGLLSEWPAVALEAEQEGWSVMPLALLVCCPDCHAQIVGSP